MKTTLAIAALMALTAASLRADGVTPEAISSLVAAQSGLTGIIPEVASTSLGQTIVAWEEVSSGGSTIRYLFIDDQGTVFAGPFTVTPLSGGATTHPRVAAATHGFILTWEETSPIAGGWQSDVRYRIFGAGSGQLGGGFANLTLTAPFYDEAHPTCGASADGIFHVAWVRRSLVQPAPTEGIWFRRFGLGGNTLDLVEVRADHPQGNFGEQDMPAICTWSTGRILVVWVDGPFGAPASVGSPDGHGSALVARWFQPGLVPIVQNGLPAGNLPLDQWGPRLDADERHSCVLAFTGDTSPTEIDAYAIRLTDTGQYIDPAPILLTPGNTTEQTLHGVAMNTGGEYVATWRDVVQTPNHPAPRSGFVRYASTGVLMESGLLDGAATLLETQALAGVGTDQFGNFRAVWAVQNPAGWSLQQRRFRRNMITPLAAPFTGSVVPLALSSPSDASYAYLVLFSFGTGPIFIDTRILKLSIDPLLLLSLNPPPGIFSGLAGTLDTTGFTVTPAIILPASPILIGLTINCAFVTQDPWGLAPTNINTISDTLSLTVQ